MEDDLERQKKSVPDENELNRALSAVVDSRNQAAQETAAEIKVAGKKKARKSRLPILLSLVAISLVALVLTRLASPTFLPASPDDSAKETIYVTVLALTAEFEETGAFPETLEAIGMDHEGLTYWLGPGGYSLTAVEDGMTAEYRSGEDLTPFREAFEALVIPAGGGD